jgi:hypothetical protein
VAAEAAVHILARQQVTLAQAEADLVQTLIQLAQQAQQIPAEAEEQADTQVLEQTAEQVVLA